MKNKTLNNLIVLGAFAVFLFGANNVSAAYGNYTTYGYNNGYNSSYTDSYDNFNSYNQYAQATAQQYAYTQQPYTYVAQPQQQIQYVQAQPQTQTQIKYVPVETVKYVTVGNTNTANTATSNQGASVVRATTTTKRVATTNTNTGLNSNTGQYVNYDANQNAMLSSAYGVYNGQQVAEPVVVDSNGVAALSVGGTGGFMPSSVFQWFIFILLVLAIIIVARMISKSFSRSAHAPVAH